MNNGEKILIVDDDATHRFMLESVLESWGYSTDEADDGGTALQMIQSSDYALVLMDFRMKNLSGLEALFEIKNLYRSIPVILMSACWSGEAITQARKNGASAVLYKPLSLGDLRNTIRIALAQRCQQLLDLQSDLK